MKISRELKAGIDRFASAIAPIVSDTVSVTMRDGSVRVGKLSHDTPCQPIVTTDDGRRFAVPDDEIVRLLSEHPTPAGAEWLTLLASSVVSGAIRDVLAATDSFGVRRNPAWEAWAAAWLGGSDRSRDAALAAKDQARSMAVYAHPGAESRCWSMADAADAALWLSCVASWTADAGDGAISRRDCLGHACSSAIGAIDRARKAIEAIA